MSIKRFVRVTTVVAVALIALYAAGIYTIRYASDNIKAAQTKHMVSLMLSRETADNSLGLTANVRSYVASGNSLFKERYSRILDVRAGTAGRRRDLPRAPGGSGHAL